MAHKCGFSAQSLCDTLVASGFARVHIQRKGYELLALAFTHHIAPDSQFHFKDFDLSLGLPLWVDDYYHFVQTMKRELTQ